MQIIIALLLILVAAKVFGEIFERFKQPAIVGELLAGIILGPTLLNFLDPLSLAATDPTAIFLDVLTTLAIFFVVFYAGVEMQMQDFYDVIKGKGLYFAIGSFIVTFLMGFLIGLYFLDNYTGAMFLGLCVAITALPVSVKILSDLGRLHTKTGHAIIGTAIVHDVISISVLGLLIGINVTEGGGDPWHLTIMILKIVFFMLIVFIAERSFHIKDGWLAKKFSSFMSKLKTREAQFSVAVIVALYFAVLAEFLGLSYIIGAFYGGLLFSPKILGSKNYTSLKAGVSSISMGFFAPIFIAYLGLLFNFRELVSVWEMFIVVLVVAMVSMFISGFLGARQAGYSTIESKIIGVGINARGMMEMVVALIGFKYGFIDKTFFTILVAMALITTMITPGLLGRLYKKLPLEEDKLDPRELIDVECEAPG
jgi:Kef-type K+ transport system membrane component KefB